MLMNQSFIIHIISATCRMGMSLRFSWKEWCLELGIFVLESSIFHRTAFYIVLSYRALGFLFFSFFYTLLFACAIWSCACSISYCWSIDHLILRFGKLSCIYIWLELSYIATDWRWHLTWAWLGVGGEFIFYFCHFSIVYMFQWSIVRLESSIVDQSHH